MGSALDATLSGGVYTKGMARGNLRHGFFRLPGADSQGNPSRIAQYAPARPGMGSTMATDKGFRRLPLRELLTDAEKRARDLSEHVHVTWLARIADLRDLSRPLRRRSHYPTLLALLNALQKLVETSEETKKLIEHLTEELNQIRDHARRERLSR